MSVANSIDLEGEIVCASRRCGVVPPQREVGASMCCSAGGPARSIEPRAGKPHGAEALDLATVTRSTVADNGGLKTLASSSTLSPSDTLREDCPPLAPGIFVTAAAHPRRGGRCHVVPCERWRCPEHGECSSREDGPSHAGCGRRRPRHASPWSAGARRPRWQCGRKVQSVQRLLLADAVAQQPAVTRGSPRFLDDFISRSLCPGSELRLGWPGAPATKHLTL